MAKKIFTATIDKKMLNEIIERLSCFTADTALIYFKTLNFHWNMVGPEFYMYHKLLEEQYEELAEGLDSLAERLRMLGAHAPASFAEYLALTSLKEPKGRLTQDKMVRELASDHLALVGIAHSLIDLCDEALDQGSSDLLIERLRFHDKAAWILDSHLKGRR